MGQGEARTPTILLIEDEAIIRMSTAAMLEDAGYQVIEAVDGDEAVAILRKGAFVDVIVTDIQLPGSLDGLGLVKLIKNDFPATRFLVTSGRFGDGEAGDYGANGYLAKPYDAAAIEAALKGVLAM